MSDSNPPPSEPTASNPPPSEPTASKAKADRLKGAAALIASIAALLTSVGAYVKKPEEKAARASYDTLASAVKEQSEQIARNHDDIVSLRNFLDGYFKAQQRTLEWPPMAAPSASSIVVPTVQGKPPLRITSMVDRTEITMPGVGDAPPIPSVGPKPKAKPLPAFDAIAR